MSTAKALVSVEAAVKFVEELAAKYKVEEVVAENNFEEDLKLIADKYSLSEKNKKKIIAILNESKKVPTGIKISDKAELLMLEALASAYGVRANKAKLNYSDGTIDTNYLIAKLKEKA